MAKRRTKSDEKKITENHAKVNGLVVEIIELIQKRVEKLPEKERWLLCSRAINSVFQSHYHLAMFAAQKMENDVAATPAPKPGGEE